MRARFASAVPLPPGLIALWRGETDASDLIGGHNGTFFAGTAVTAPSVTASGESRWGLQFRWHRACARTGLRRTEAGAAYGGSVGISYARAAAQAIVARGSSR